MTRAGSPSTTSIPPPAGCHPPFPFLAAAAERTRRIRLGTAAVTLPLEDPIRVAEDAAVLGALSGGRLELGVGSGAGPAPFAVFGKDAGGGARTTRRRWRCWPGHWKAGRWQVRT